MLWDVLFLVAGLPAEWRIFDKNYGIVEIGADMLKLLQSASNLEDVSRFVRGKELSVAIFRVDSSSEIEAVSEAKEHLEGVLDGLYIVGEKLAKVSPYVFIRKERGPHLVIKVFSSEGAWATVHGSSEFEAQCAQRRTAVLEKLLSYFDTLSTKKRVTELEGQLIVSVKMYAQAARARSFGVQFLCKFSALEGLLCGSTRKNKGQLLRERTRALFKTADSQSLIGELWEKRCVASHQAHAFYSPILPGSVPLETFIPQLENLFIGVLYFSFEHLSSSTVDDLWTNAHRFSLPPIITLERPANAFKAGVRNALSGPVGEWIGAGSLIDPVLEKLAAAAKE